MSVSCKKGKLLLPFWAWKDLVFLPEFGAGNETRTRDLNLGKVALYQLSYSRISKPQLYAKKTQPFGCPSEFLKVSISGPSSDLIQGF